MRQELSLPHHSHSFHRGQPGVLPAEALQQPTLHALPSSPLALHIRFSSNSCPPLPALLNLLANSTALLTRFPPGDPLLLHCQPWAPSQAQSLSSPARTFCADPGSLATCSQKRKEGRTPPSSIGYELGCQATCVSHTPTIYSFISNSNSFTDSVWKLMSTVLGAFRLFSSVCSFR